MTQAVRTKAARHKYNDRSVHVRAIHYGGACANIYKQQDCAKQASSTKQSDADNLSMRACWLVLLFYFCCTTTTRDYRKVCMHTCLQKQVKYSALKMSRLSRRLSATSRGSKGLSLREFACISMHTKPNYVLATRTQL